MGKSMQGAGGALVMGSLLNSIITRSRESDLILDESPEEWLRNTHMELQRVFEAFDGSMFVSCVMGLIDEEIGRLYYFNAEHPYTVLFRKDTSTFLESKINVHKIGFPGQELGPVESYLLEEGDVLFAGSDGRENILVLKNGTDPPVVNQDESLFLEIVDQARGELYKIPEVIRARGAIIDDLSLIQISYRSDSFLNESRPIYYRRKVVGLIRSKQYAEALELIENMPEKESLNLAYYRALCLARMERHGEAARHLTGVEKQIRESYSALFLLGTVYENMGKLDEAERYYEKAHLLHPNNVKAERALKRIRGEL